MEVLELTEEYWRERDVQGRDQIRSFSLIHSRVVARCVAIEFA